MKKFLGLAFVAMIATVVGCNDGSIIGNDLLENEAIELAYDDNFELEAKTIRGDSIATYRAGVSSGTYLLGQLEDPVFGNASSDIYTGITFGSSLPDFDNSTIDSVVLELEYDTLGFYGEDDVVHTLDVFTVEEDWFDLDTLYSDQSLAIGMSPIGSKSFVPDPIGDSVRFQVRVTDVDSFITLTSRINIRLDDAFGQSILDDADAALSDTSLVDSFKGLYIRSTTEGSSMMGINFVSNSTVMIPKLAIYYTQTEDGVEQKRTYNYRLRSQVFSQFIMDNSSATVGSVLNDGEAGREMIYTQGMAGVNAEVMLPDLTALKGNLINSAQLVLTVKDEDADLYPVNRQLLMSRYDADGERVLIEDIARSGLTVAQGLAILDGVPRSAELETGETVRQVTFNITDFVRYTIEDDEPDSRLVISPVGRSETPRRTIFYGSDHPTYPAKLRIAYTIN